MFSSNHLSNAPLKDTGDQHVRGKMINAYRPPAIRKLPSRKKELIQSSHSIENTVTAEEERKERQLPIT